MKNVVQRLRRSVEELDSLTERTEQWPPDLQEVLSEVANLAQRVQRLADAVERRPEGSQLNSYGRVFADDTYTSTPEVPFPGTGVHIVHPNSRHWGGESSQRRLYESPSPSENMEVVAYLDTDDQRLIDKALDALEELADVLGYSDLEVSEEVVARYSVGHGAASSPAPSQMKWRGHQLSDTNPTSLPRMLRRGGRGRRRRVGAIEWGPDLDPRF